MNAVRRLAAPAAARSFYDELVAAIGAAGAAALLEAFAGKQLHVPAKPGAEHPITRAIGPDAAAALAEFYHGTTITLPITPAKRAQVLALVDAGKRPNDIAHLARVSRSFVYKVIDEARRLGDNADAADLFG